MASQVVHELGGLPLAIDQAAAFLKENSSSLQEYLDALRLQVASGRSWKSVGAALAVRHILCGQ